MGFYPAYVQRSKGLGKIVLHSRACKYYSWPHRPIQILGDILGRLWLWSSACEEPGAGTCVLGIKPGQTSHSVYLLPDLLSAKRPSVELKNTLLSHFWLFYSHDTILRAFPTGSTYYDAGNTKPHHTWERHYLLEFAIRHSTRMDELLCNPGWGGTAQISTGSQTWGNALCLELNTHHWKRGEGGSPGLACPTHSSSP